MNTVNNIKDRIKRVLVSSGYGLYKIPVYGRPERKFIYFKRLFDSITHIDGDIVECGVGVGKSLLTLTGLTIDEKKGRQIWGFDSFEGFPEPSPEDKSPRNPQKGEWNVATPESITNFFIEEGKIDPAYIAEHVVLVKGFFQDSVSQYPDHSIALLHLDGDLYDSYKTCLEYFWPKVAYGGVVLFDEYLVQAPAWPGPVKAINEFFKDKKVLIRMDTEFDRYYIYKQ